ncbi:MAG: hypothetical protein Kow00108_19240 [Calditrichia bacterium]
MSNNRKTNFPWAGIGILIGVILMFVLTVNAFDGRGVIKVSDIEIQGNRLIPTTEISTIIKEMRLDSISEQELPMIKKQLESLSFLDEVIVRIDHPSRLIIRVKEFEPVAVVINSKMWYMNEHGDLYPYRFINQYKDLIVITGLKDQNDSLLNKARYILAALKEYPLSYHHISEIHFTKDQPILILTQNAIQAKVEVKNIHQNLLYLEEFITQLGEELKNSKIKSINLVHENKIYLSERGII